jgi:trans-aconitate methyltransferase
MNTDSEPDFYEIEKNVEHYIRFTPAHDGSMLVDQLGRYVTDGARILELGMGPGKDFKLLNQRYQMTGSDFSRVFLDRYRKIDPDAELMHLDARTLDTSRRFDAIFSNKALIHMSPEELRQSFGRQNDVLNADGVMLHSFWYGKGENTFNDLTLVYHNERDLTAMLEESFEILELERHAKMAEGDSIYVIARKRSVGSDASI